MRHNEIVVLYSGGTDSTLSAALMAQKYDKVRLVTYHRFGFFNVDNPKVNVEKLKNKYGDDKFTFEIINMDSLAKHVFYEGYFYNMFRHGFFLLSICGLCKLAMHMKTVKYCLDNQVANVCDGANKGMHLFPDQMRQVINEIGIMYAKFGIKYTNPVFDYEGPEDTEFADKVQLERIMPAQKQLEEKSAKKTGETTGCQLCQMGLMPSENVKGTEMDRKMQPRCFQFILFNIFVKWYYMYDHSYEQYQQATLIFYKDKISRISRVLEDYVKQGLNSRYYKLFAR